MDLNLQAGQITGRHQLCLSIQGTVISIYNWKTEHLYRVIKIHIQLPKICDSENPLAS